MAIFESMIFAIVAALVSLKAMLLAAAVVLFVHSLSARIRQRKAAPKRYSPEHSRLDLWA
jgi:hypothetical protein